MVDKTPLHQVPTAADATGDLWPEPLVELFRTDRVRLVRLAYLITGSNTAAEELVQEAFIKTRQAWAGVQSPKYYVQTAVVNGCRSWGRHQQVVDKYRPLPPSPSLQEPDELWDALDRLAPKRRAAIVLRYYLDLPHREIAEILGCRPATVRTTIHRALSQLRGEIAR